MSPALQATCAPSKAWRKRDLSNAPSHGGSTSGAQYVEAETPAGVVDGSNATFTLAGAPSQPSSLSLFRNGVLQQVGSDYTLTGSTVQFLAGAIPQLGDTLMAGYRLASGAPLVGPQARRVERFVAALQR